VCPALTSATADPALCSHTVARASFTGTSFGAVTDWYPTWKVRQLPLPLVIACCSLSSVAHTFFHRASVCAPQIYKGSNAAAMSMVEMEGRANVTGLGYLSLTGMLTVFALNEPTWINTFYLTQFQTVTADVQVCDVPSHNCFGRSPSAFVLPSRASSHPVNSRS
jgi:hypothetical protein